MLTFLEIFLLAIHPQTTLSNFFPSYSPVSSDSESLFEYSSQSYGVFLSPSQLWAPLSQNQRIVEHLR